MIYWEWPLQRALKWFVARAIAVPHVFACHDRGAPRSEHEHIVEAARGIRRGWPDTELVLPKGRTFRCELKRYGRRIEIGSAQDHIRLALNQLNHPTSEADSVRGYAEECCRFDVPLKPNWPTLAQLADEMVAADIREQQAKAAAKSAAASSTTDPPLIKPRPKVRRRVAASTNVRIFAAMKPQP